MVAGVFDSGVGGLTVVKSLLEHNIFSKIVYFGDTARVPYGIRDKNTIIRYSLETVEFLKNFDVDILIPACNTISAYAIDDIEKSSKKPVVGVIESGVEALKKIGISTQSRVSVIATTATIRSNQYQYLLEKEGFSDIKAKATPLFVPLVEEGVYGGELLDTVMREYFAEFTDVEAMILGCTHFPLLSDSIKRYFGEIALVHPGEAIVEYLKREYSLRERYTHTELDLFASSNPSHLREVAREWL